MKNINEIAQQMCNLYSAMSEYIHKDDFIVETYIDDQIVKYVFTDDVGNTITIFGRNSAENSLIGSISIRLIDLELEETEFPPILISLKDDPEEIVKQISKIIFKELSFEIFDYDFGRIAGYANFNELFAYRDKGIKYHNLSREIYHGENFNDPGSLDPWYM